MSHRAARYAFLGLGSLALASCVVLVCGCPTTRLSAAQVPQPSFAYVSVWSTSLDPQTGALYQNLANAIARFSGIPNARGAYYSHYNDGVDWAIGSWGAGVYDAAADGSGGYNVTLLVGPIFTTTPAGSGTDDVAGGYYEIFNVDTNGDITYISSQDPDGWAGGQLIELS